ncbi:hypothetical protein J6590_070903 [Homalodisca vitripennis]|nr:hypothetical protein J6590_070903 [Homalodisca vitripennis]
MVFPALPYQAISKDQYFQLVSVHKSFKVKVTHGGETPCSFPKHSTGCSAVIVFVSYVSVFA